MTHAHISTWVIALILFFVTLYLVKSGKEKQAKIVQMILRVFYILVLVTGLLLFFDVGFFGLYPVKLIFGILVIGFLEMVLVRTRKGKSTGMFWALLIISLLVTLYLGFSLPMGFEWFKLKNYEGLKKI